MKSSVSIEKSFEERFDRKFYEIGESDLHNHDLHKETAPLSKYFRIKFSPSIPEETKIFLSNKLPTIIDFPKKFGLKIPLANHMLRFLDKESYEREIGYSLSKNIILPASRIKKIDKNRSYEVTIILPYELNSADLIVNITRNVFSKLCGNIFFNEQIKPLEFYREGVTHQKQFSATNQEILFIIEELNFSSKCLQAFCKVEAKSYLLDPEKELEKIQKQLISEWHEKLKLQSLSIKEQNTLNSIFLEFKESFHTNPLQYEQKLLCRIKQLNNQLQFILPHEREVYESFSKNNISHFVRSLKNKLEEISALIGFIEELYYFLKNNPSLNDIEGLFGQVRSRMKELRSSKKVIHFYVPDIPKDLKLKRIQKRFPLRLIKMLPHSTPLKNWKKEIKGFEKSYAESIYSKLYTALYCLSEWLLAIEEKKIDSYLKKTDGPCLKKLISVLKYRYPAIVGLKDTLGIILELFEQNISENNASKSTRQSIPLDDYSKAWSYFISSILSMHYYENSNASEVLPQGFNAENYLKSILEFVDKQCSSGINHFHIVKLLWMIYEEKNDVSLEFLIHSIQNPRDILRYTLSQTMRPKTKKVSIEKRINKLLNYRDAWISVYQNSIIED